MKRKLAIGSAVALFCLLVVGGRACWEGRAALDAGDKALANSDTAEAIAQWRRAARWYLPLAPHVSEAYDRLESLAKQAEKTAQIEDALAAWRGVRGSILATRSFYTPHSERLDPANRRIAALMAQQEMRGPAPGDASREEREAWHYELLSRDGSPSVPWSVLALLGFALWIGGGVFFAMRGMNKEGRLVGQPAAIAGGCVALGLVIWLLGLYNA